MACEACLQGSFRSEKCPNYKQQQICLPWPPWAALHHRDRFFSIRVASPKGAKTSKEGGIANVFANT